MSVDPPPVGLLLSRDLIFTAKVTGTARALGRAFVCADSPRTASAQIERWSPRVVFVDLAAGEVARAEVISALRSSHPSVPFLAFGSHVDASALAAASAAGCDPVMPRSRFSATLPDLIRAYLGANDEPPPA